MVNIVFFRRAVWSLLFCLASSVAADSYHPHILKSQVVSLDVKAIEGNANSGTPFELVLGETQLTVVLSPAPVWPEEGLTVLEVGRDGEVTQRIVKGNITYAGDVLGEDPRDGPRSLRVEESSRRACQWSAGTRGPDGNGQSSWGWGWDR